MSKKNFIKQAIKKAGESILRHKVGAIIVNGGRIISCGRNERRHTRLITGRRHKQSLCAEQSAILKLLKNRRQAELVGSTLYVTRMNTKGSALAKPCSCCQEIIKSVGIRKVFYTDNNSQVLEFKP
jgi:deoxycytidylate deaminase